MDRRNFVLGLGALAGGGAALGTGAFSSVVANRDVTVNVSGDASAYLGIQPHSGPNGQYATTTSDDTLALDFTGDNSNQGNGIAGGEGVNMDAATTFNGVFTVENQGTQDIEVSATPLTFIEDSNGPDESSLVVLIVPALTPSVLSPGELKSFGVSATTVGTGGESGLALNDELEITAEEA